MPGDPAHQGSEQQRRDNGPNQAQKDQPENPEIHRRRRPVVAQDSTRQHGHKNPDGERSAECREGHKCQDRHPAGRNTEGLWNLQAGPSQYAQHHTQTRQSKGNAKKSPGHERFLTLAFRFLTAPAWIKNLGRQNRDSRELYRSMLSRKNVGSATLHRSRCITNLHTQSRRKCPEIALEFVPPFRWKSITLRSLRRLDPIATYPCHLKLSAR